MNVAPWLHTRSPDVILRSGPRWRRSGVLLTYSWFTLRVELIGLGMLCFLIVTLAVVAVSSWLLLRHRIGLCGGLWRLHRARALRRFLCMATSCFVHGRDNDDVGAGILPPLGGVREFTGL